MLIALRRSKLSTQLQSRYVPTLERLVRWTLMEVDAYSEVKMLLLAGGGRMVLSGSGGQAEGGGKFR